MSYEKEIEDKKEKGQHLPGRLHFSILKYFWQSNPLIGHRKGTIPYFLRKVEILKNLSEMDLYVLSNYLHLRAFEEKELIFEQGDRGVGFYFILSGEVAIVASDESCEAKGAKETGWPFGDDCRVVVKLRRHDHFGELALLQDDHARNAWAVATTPCLLLGLFRPDMDDLILRDPVVGARLLQSLGLLLASRISAITTEMTLIKRQLVELQNYGKIGQKTE